MRTFKLGDALTEEQIDAVLDIIQHYHDPIERVRKLKAYLAPMTAQLEQKGIVADYLAFVIEHLACVHQDYSRN
jgi:hypothetical protein